MMNKGAYMNKCIFLLCALAMSTSSLAHSEGVLLLDAMHHWFAAHHGAAGIAVLALLALMVFSVKKYVLKK